MTSSSRRTNQLYLQGIDSFRKKNKLECLGELVKVKKVTGFLPKTLWGKLVLLKDLKNNFQDGSCPAFKKKRKIFDHLPVLLVLPYRLVNNVI